MNFKLEIGDRIEFQAYIEDYGYCSAINYDEIVSSITENGDINLVSGNVIYVNVCLNLIYQRKNYTDRRIMSNDLKINGIQITKLQLVNYMTYIRWN